MVRGLYPIFLPITIFTIHQSFLKQVLTLIEKRGRISKKQLIGELNWGKQFKFGRYRNRLRLDDRIRFTNDGYEWVG